MELNCMDSGLIQTLLGNNIFQTKVLVRKLTEVFRKLSLIKMITHPVRAYQFTTQNKVILQQTISKRKINISSYLHWNI